MVGQYDTFGGGWTEVKLDKVSRYLAEYVKVMKNRSFTTMYVDAFAGTGFMKPIKQHAGLFFEEQETVPAGSARLALDVNPPFSRYVFIEKDRKRHQRLLDLAKAKPGLRIDFMQGDANDKICELCGATNWRNTRAVVFLDPFGMQVEWRTIEALGRTRAVDLWYLVPTAIGMARLMPRNKPPDESWQRKLDLTLGDGGWRDLYKRHIVHDLIEGEVEREVRTGGSEEIEEYVMSRLRSAFHSVSPHVARLRNSRNHMYSLVFCCANPNKKAQEIAMRIANHILTMR